MHVHNYGSLLACTVEAMLPRFSDPEICLTMNLRISWDHYRYRNRDTHLKFSRDNFMVFHRPSNYITVLIKDVTGAKSFLPPFSKDKNPYKKQLRFKQLCHDDSSWRTEGFQWIFNLHLESWAFFEVYNIEGRNIEPSLNYVYSETPKYRLIEQMQIIDKDNRWKSDYLVQFGAEVPINDVSSYLGKKE